MEDPINANPTVIDVSNIPSRIDELQKFKKNQYKSDASRDLTSLSFFKDANFLSDSVPSPPEVASDVDMDSSDSLSYDFGSGEGKYDDVADYDDDEEEQIDSQEIYDLISTISDPEHPLTLAQLAVVNLEDIQISHGEDKNKDISEVLIKITPTITHCSLATLIGLGIRVRLERCLPPRFRIRILIKEGTHQSENQVNKQLNDKERVAAACENDQLLSVVSQMLSTCK